MVGTVPLAIQEAISTPTSIIMTVGEMQILPPYWMASSSSDQGLPLSHATSRVMEMEASRLMWVGMFILNTTDPIMETNRKARQKTAQPKGISLFSFWNMGFLSYFTQIDLSLIQNRYLSAT